MAENRDNKHISTLVNRVKNYHQKILHNIEDFKNSGSVENPIDKSDALSYTAALETICRSNIDRELEIAHLIEYPFEQEITDTAEEVLNKFGEIKRRICDDSLDGLRYDIHILIQQIKYYITTHGNLLRLASENMGVTVGKEIAGAFCKVMTLDNIPVASGTIESIDDRKIDIVYRREAELVEDKEIVKVSLARGAYLIDITGRAENATEDGIEVIPCVVAKNKNVRGTFRLTLNRPGILKNYLDDLFDCLIVDISQEGCLIQVESEIYRIEKPSEIKFDLGEQHFELEAIKTRQINTLDKKIQYGLKFRKIPATQSNRLLNSIYKQQAEQMKGAQG
jgi:hypothetical protein